MKRLLLIFIAVITFIAVLTPPQAIASHCNETQRDQASSCVAPYRICGFTQTGDTLYCCLDQCQEETNKTNNTTEITETKPLGRIGEGSGLGPFSNIGLTLEEAGSALENILSGVIGIITIAISLWFMFQVFIGGISWVSAGGDAKKVEGARERITNAIIGLIITVAAWSLIGIVGTFLGLDILSPATIIETINSTVNGGTP